MSDFLFELLPEGHALGEGTGVDEEAERGVANYSSA
jgi:hypothetical protein